MSDLEQEISMLEGLDLSGTVAPVAQPVQPAVVPVQTTQTIAQPVTPVAAVAPVQPSVTAPLNLDAAQNNIDTNQFVTVNMGQKVSTAVMEKFKGQKDERKRVAVFMPWW